MLADVRPYLVPSQGTVTWGPWTYWRDDAWAVLPDAIEGWDPGTDIHLQRVVHVDTDRLRRETGLEDPSTISVAVSWTSSTTGMTDAAVPIPLALSPTTTAEAALLGGRVGGIVRVRSSLSLVVPPHGAPPGVARLAGSVLSEDEWRLTLEGALSMFPVHDIDFSHTRLSPDASWHLETTTELASPFMGSFRLLLNRRDTELMTAVSRGSKDKRQEALCEELEAGVAMLLLELAVLMGEEIDERETWPPDSVGDVLARTLAAVPSPFDPHIPAGPPDVADFRTRLAGATRSSGHGRQLR